MTVVVKTENLGKKFIISHERPERYTALRDVIVNKSKEIINKTRSLFNDDYHPEGEAEEFWALKDINLEIKQGDRLGIIGKNGAGKSTLLKILSRITEPTTGWVGIKGRVASLLEVGTGFHPELTGKENIFLNGAILGMTRSEIKKKFDEIVDFSGVEKFLDTPVKRYSSGMRVRLAFSVAAHLEPEILIIDEVLAVGDASFQKKCLGKMQDVSVDGRTVLFVSHNITAIQSLCSRAILLEQGQIIDQGETSTVCNHYLNKAATNCIEQHWNNIKIAPGNEIVKFKSIVLRTPERSNNSLITIETSFEIAFEVWNIRKGLSLHISMHLYNLSGDVIFASASPVVDSNDDILTFVCSIPPHLLNDGTYSITALIVNSGNALFKMEDMITFEVNETERTGAWFGKWPGSVRPKLNWKVNSNCNNEFLHST
jgi:lipopolysaccharide transport system ATP-binding protein